MIIFLILIFKPLLLNIVSGFLKRLLIILIVVKLNPTPTPIAGMGHWF